MTRTLSTAVSNLLDDELVKPFLAVKLPFPSGGTLRLWTGHGDITVDSETYSGAGQFLGISIVEESEEVKATGITLILSGVPSTLLGSLITEEFQGMLVVVHLGFLGDSNAVTGSFKIFSGLADNVEIAETGTTSTVSMKVESRLILLEQSSSRRYTNEDQQTSHANDTSLRFVATLQDKEIIWGKA